MLALVKSLDHFTKTFELSCSPRRGHYQGGKTLGFGYFSFKITAHDLSPFVWENSGEADMHEDIKDC